MYAKITSLRDGNITLSTLGAKRIPLEKKGSFHEFNTAEDYKRFQAVIERYRIKQSIKLEIFGKKGQENKPVPEKTKVVNKPVPEKLKTDSKPVLEPEKPKVIDNKKKKKKFL